MADERPTAPPPGSDPHGPAPSPIDATGDRPLIAVARALREALRTGGRAVVLTPDPDGGVGLWPGERRPDGAPHRSWRALSDLADELGARLGTPVPRPDGRVLVPFTRLPPETPLQAHGGDPSGRYGRDAAFSRLSKLEHPGFLLPLLDALAFVRPPDGASVLVLGCHAGDEIAALGMLDPAPRALRVTGVDLAADALERARARFPDATFVQQDVNALPSGLGRFALIVAIGLLQSPGVDDRGLLRTLVQRHAEPHGALLLGLPNGRFRGGEASWGARTVNYREPDLSLLIRDLAAHRRYLNQHGYRTRIGGRYDLLLGATRSVRA